MLKKPVAGLARIAAPQKQKIQKPGAAFDELTPACEFCGEKHIGTHIPAVLMLTGSYVVDEESGVEIFALSPDIGITVAALPHGGLAFAVNVNSPAIMVAHEECRDQLVNEFFGDDEDDEDEEYSSYNDVETIEGEDDQ